MRKIRSITMVAVCGAALISLLGGCGKQVTRIDANSTVDLSGKWNDTDSRLVAEEMITDCLSRPWLANKFPGAAPTVIVGDVRNKSHEHINVETFVNDLQRSLINSGKVEFVASKTERTSLREERADQMAGNTSDATTKAPGNEYGADLMLIGSINTIVDQEGDKGIIYYQTDLELVNLSTNLKLWIGSKKIKKFITRSSTAL